MSIKSMNLLLLCIAVGSLFFLKLPVTATQEEVDRAEQALPECQFEKLSESQISELEAQSAEKYHQQQKTCTEAIVQYLKTEREGQ